jgi:hypothetical protein
VDRHASTEKGVENMSQFKPTEEHKFLSELDVLPKIAEGRAAAPAPLIVAPDPLVGTWLNANKSRPGIVKVILSKTGADLFVEIFGACVPTPCDWHKVKAVAYSIGVSDTSGSGFTAHYDQGFADRIVTGELKEGALILDVFTVFKDGSGRNNYHTEETFYRP